MKEIILSSPTKKEVSFKNGSGYTHWFVRSDKGNYVLKGTHKECQAYLEDKQNWFANCVWFHKSELRNRWYFWKDSVYIAKPRMLSSITGRFMEKFNYNGWSKYRVKALGGYSNLEFNFKRMPNKWIKEFEQF